MKKTEAEMAAASGNGADPAIAAAATGTIEDIEQFCIQPGDAAPSSQKVLLRIPVRKPPKSDFIRVSADPEFQRTVFVYEDEKSFREAYLIMPAIAPALGGVVSRRLLQLAITRQGALFFWPVALPAEDGRVNEWNAAAIAAANLARTRWIRIAANMETRSYDIFEAAPGVTIPEPVWPPLTMLEALNLAFAGKIVASTDHPIVRSLLGHV
jgi:hypothetical protein